MIWRDDHYTTQRPLQEPTKALAKAKASKVFASTSHLEVFEGALDPGAAPLKA